jgi:glutathione synthase/RimK-type ligase-like ATP-grasp enzyme
MRVAIVASEATRDIGENTIIRDALISQGHTVSIIPYDVPQLPDWDADFDAVFVRTIWGYESRGQDYFAALLSSLDGVRARVLNTVQTLRWNSDKALYLAEIAAAGVPVMPTAHIPGDCSECVRKKKKKKEKKKKKKKKTCRKYWDCLSSLTHTTTRRQPR